MKITISVNGRFHAFDLAGQLHKRGHLHRLITSYPAWKAAEWGIPREKVVSLLPLEVIKRVTKYIPFKSLRKFLVLLQKQLFDLLVAWFIPLDSDIFVGWSSSSLFSIRRAKKNKILTVLERGSAHMLVQLKFLKEEHAIWGSDLEEHHRGITERELNEYDISDYICVASMFVKRSFVERGVNSEKIIKVPYGVDLSSFRKIKKQDIIFRVICSGVLSFRKGSHYLLQAVHEIDISDIELWHFGGISPEMQKFIDKYRRKNIILKGSKPQKELYRYYSQGSVFCMPSIEEGLAMVQLQAMSCGLPVICTTNTGGEDFIDDGKEGFIISIRDVEAIKSKIMYLYENRAICQEMGHAAQRKVQAGLSWDDYGAKMVSEYQNKINSIMTRD